MHQMRWDVQSSLNVHTMGSKMTIGRLLFLLGFWGTTCLCELVLIKLRKCGTFFFSPQIFLHILSWESNYIYIRLFDITLWILHAYFCLPTFNVSALKLHYASWEEPLLALEVFGVIWGTCLAIIFLASPRWFCKLSKALKKSILNLHYL